MTFTAINGTTARIAPGPWLLFKPDGTFDGAIWSPKTLDEAQKKLARLARRRWALLEREGWRVRRGTKEELSALIAAHYEAQAGEQP